MDPTAYLAAKENGQASIILHGTTTLLVSMPEGDPFDAKTGQPKPPVDRGYQPADLDAFQEADAKALIAAQEALAKAQERVDAWQQIKAEPAYVAAKKALADSAAAQVAEAKP